MYRTLYNYLGVYCIHLYTLLSETSRCWSSCQNNRNRGCIRFWYCHSLLSLFSGEIGCTAISSPSPCRLLFHSMLVSETEMWHQVHEANPSMKFPSKKNLVIIGKWATLCFAPGRSLSDLVSGGILIVRSSAKVCGYYPCGFSGRGAVCWVPGVPRVPRGPSERWLERAWWWLTILIWVNYNDLTVLPHWKSWLVRGIIPFYGPTFQVSEIL